MLKIGMTRSGNIVKLEQDNISIFFEGKININYLLQRRKLSTYKDAYKNTNKNTKYLQTNEEFDISREAS